MGRRGIAATVARVLAVAWTVALAAAGCGGGGAPAATESAAAVAAPAPAGAFANPIVPAGANGAADPSVVWRDGWYVYCRSLGDRAIGIARARRLQDIGTAPMTPVWTAPADGPTSAEVWAPELRFLRGRWVIYFAADDGRNANHRMHALTTDDADPTRGWRDAGPVRTDDDHWAIDGTAFEHADGRLFFVWSGWRDAGAGFPQVLYIAEMSDPFTIRGERHEIAAPEYDWERRGAPLLEGPAVLQQGGRLRIAYSASGSWTDDYAIGLLSLADGADPLDAAAWHKRATPLMSRRAAGGAWGPGHNAFVPSPDGREQWIVYHAIDAAGGGWARRSVRAQRLDWDAAGEPLAMDPAAPGAWLAAPSGTEGPMPAVPLASANP